MYNLKDTNLARENQATNKSNNHFNSEIITNPTLKKSIPEERVPNPAFSGPSPAHPLLEKKPPLSQPNSIPKPIQLTHQLRKRYIPEDRVPNPAFPGPSLPNPLIRPYPPLFKPKPPFRLIKITDEPWEIGRPEERIPKLTFPGSSPLLLPEPLAQLNEITNKPWEIFKPEEQIFRQPFSGPSSANPVLQAKASVTPIEIASQLWKKSKPEERVPNPAFPGPFPEHPLLLRKPLTRPINFRKYNKFLHSHYLRSGILESRNLIGRHVDVRRNDLTLLHHPRSRKASTLWYAQVMMVILTIILLSIVMLGIYQNIIRWFRTRKIVAGKNRQRVDF
ncbi:hypothetical protein EV44_g5695 [Erysiphe necator]|uniref:Uncharacterized protein n=1 Tax=Uncinula necator TaxID=52586 RepID=A0A0B1PB09_UNCNE|nr:hypothetical protein EV44_g5695 [Erysiphe necator]